MSKLLRANADARLEATKITGFYFAYLKHSNSYALVVLPRDCVL